FGSLRASVAAGRTAERWAASFIASAGRSDGISAADVRNRYGSLGRPGLRNREADGSRSLTLAAQGRLRLSEAVEVDALARYADARVDIDGYPLASGFLFADT